MLRSLTGGRRILLEWLLIAILATAGLVAAVSTNLFRRADNLVYDRLTWLREQPAREDIIIIAIDDESISRLGRFPWPRQRHAELLDRLQQARPRAILYDVLFVEPGPGDRELAAAVARTRPILPLFMEIPGRDGQPVSVIRPIDSLRRAGAEVGHANLSPDEEGIVRRVYLVEGAANQLWPHIAARAACEAAGIACSLPIDAGGKNHVRLKPFLIPYAGGRQHFRTVPFSAVLDGGVPDAFFRDRIVLVGATATGHSDTYATPMGERETLMPGVELNANIIQGLISGRALTPAPTWARYLLVLTPLWLLLAGFLTARPRFNFFLGLLLGTGVILVSAGAFFLAGAWISPITAIAGLVLVYPTWAWRRLEASNAYMREELERFRRDPDVLVDAASPAADLIQSDIEMLRGAIGRARDLQHFVSDTLKGLPDASIVVGTGGRIRMMNERALTLLGKGEGKHFSWLAAKLTAGQIAVPPEEKPGPDSLPTEIVDAAGRVFNVRWSPISDRKGGLGAWVLRLADITDLRTATRQREEALQLLTHDMRSPQASIIATLSQARDSVDADLARRIENYARRTLELADGYVQLARAEAQPLVFDDVNFCDVVLDAVDDLWPLSSARPIHIQAEGCDGEILVRADRGLLTRAVINLVGNGIKYGPAGSEVRCSLEVAGLEAVFTVCDEGPGLNEDQLAHLFKPFRQVGKSIAEGVGLGLAFVSSVASRHGGSVSCRSSPGKGSCFELRLPVAEEAVS